MAETQNNDHARQLIQGNDKMMGIMVKVGGMEIMMKNMIANKPMSH